MSLTAAAVALMIGSAAPQAVVSGPEDTVSAQVPDALPSDPVATSPEVQTGADGDITVFDRPVADPDSDAAGPVVSTEAGQEGETQGGEIVVTWQKRSPPGDPLVRLNETSFVAVQAVDKAVLEPVAKVYNKGLPHPVREGLRNFFSNLREPVIFVAYLLELKPGKAAETAGRFAINSTIGVAGLVDMAKRKPFHLPYRPNGFADVMGYYGVGPGPYMYLPIIGPTTLRDLIGDTVDKLASPALLGKPFTRPEVAIPMMLVNQLGERAAFDEEIGRIRENDDPYSSYRDLYLRQRDAEIDALHGRVTSDVVPVYGRSMRTPGGKDDKNAKSADESGKLDTDTSPQP